MRAILNLSDPPYPWIKEFFPEMSPYMLPFLGKPLVEFYIDYCSLHNISQVLIIQQDFSDELIDFLENGSKWGIEISSGVGTASGKMKEILSRNSAFIANSQFLLLDGFFFPLYDKNATVPTRPPRKAIHPRIRVVPEDEEFDVPFCEEIEIDSLLRYYDLNMELLSSHTGRLLMKGYKAEAGVFMGMNNALMRLSQLNPPFVLGDDVQIEGGAQVGPRVIIGDTCIVDRRTHLSESIIFDKTYVGADLNLCKKIVYRNNIVDPIQGIKVSFVDSSFSSKLEGNLVTQWGRQCITSIFALFFILSMSPLFLLYTLIGLPRAKPITYIMASGRKSTHPLPVYEKEHTSKNAWFFKLSLDKFHPLRHAMLGRIKLIGDTLWDCENQKIILARYRDYKPGALTYSDSIGDLGFYESVIGDLFYRHNRTLRTDILLVLRTFLSKIFRGSKNDIL